MAKTKLFLITAFSMALLCSCGKSTAECNSSKPETAAKTTTAAATLADSQSSEPLQEQAPLITKELFENALDKISVEINGDIITEQGSINGQSYSLTIDLTKWEQNTTPEDIVGLSRLFWQSYPKMYERFSDITFAPADVTLAIENEGYEIADAGEDRIHLHDMWLAQNPDDYDCITHELGHIAQQGVYWNDDCLEYSGYTELFADLCRMEYPLDNGIYNDSVWTLQDISVQDSRESSVRFLVWLDHFYSTTDTDIIRNFCTVCYEQHYTADDWQSAWAEIFSGTKLEGLTIDEVWDMYASSEFAYLSSNAQQGEKSPLLQEYDIRAKLS